MMVHLPFKEVITYYNILGFNAYLEVGDRHFRMFLNFVAISLAWGNFFLGEAYFS